MFDFEPWQSLFTSEELLHGGLFDITLLRNELVQRGDQRIHIAQRLSNGTLFWERGDSEE